MQNAWRFVEDEILRDRLKEAKGIGTPATRAEIIAGLRDQGFLKAERQNIVPTERGLALFGVLERADPALVDPGVTAELECLLDDVVLGKQEMMGAIDAVCDAARRIIDRLGSGSVAGETVALGEALDGGNGGGDRPPTAAMKRFAASIAKRKGIKPPAGYTKSGAVCPGVSGSARTGAGGRRYGRGIHGGGGVQVAECGAGIVCRGDCAREERWVTRRGQGLFSRDVEVDRCEQGIESCSGPQGADAECAPPGSDAKDVTGENAAETEIEKRGRGRGGIRQRQDGFGDGHAVADSLREQGGRARTRRPLRSKRLVCSARRQSCGLPRAWMAVVPLGRDSNPEMTTYRPNTL